MTDTADSPIRIQARRILSDGRFRLETVRFEQTAVDGSRETLDREVYHSGTGAAVLPVNREAGTVLLVRQLRIPALLRGGEATLLEACAGMVDEGDEPLDTVRKEAEQEMGYRLHDVRKVCEVYTSPGACTELLHLFTGRFTPADRTGAGGGVPAEGERITLLELPLAEALEMVADGRIRDAKTVILLQHAGLGS